jgi:hypothetical protein
VKPWLHWSQLTAGRLRVLGSRSGLQGINQGGASDWKVSSQVMRAYLILRRTAILMLRVWAVARTFGSASMALVLPLCKATPAGSKRGLAVGGSPLVAVEGRWSP